MTTQTGAILVVDDDVLNRTLLSASLQEQGHTVEVVENGRQALDSLAARPFDVVLLDLLMPEMDGFQVLEHMKANDWLQHIPVIVISAVDEMESVVRCIEMGAMDHLPKPFNPVLLRARIDSSLERKRLRDLQLAYTHYLDQENKRKSSELEKARQIQLAMLPASPPTLAHLDIAAQQRTASEVGGDYYDFFPQADGKLLVVIGDATGHGVGASLMVALTKACLLAINDADLQSRLGKINAVLREIDLGYRLNMALLLLEFSALCDGGLTVRASGGGMPPIYILRGNGRLEELAAPGLPLGVVDERDYPLVECRLQAGDVVLLSSDGLAETFNPAGEMLSFARVEAELGQIDCQLTADQVLQRVAGTGDNWSQGHPLQDDVTLVAIRIRL
jgi:sigma-B regulation protein RsbU (phosphoserine phosphatase)